MTCESLPAFLHPLPQPGQHHPSSSTRPLSTHSQTQALQHVYTVIATAPATSLPAWAQSAAAAAAVDVSISSGIDLFLHAIRQNAVSPTLLRDIFDHTESTEGHGSSTRLAHRLLEKTLQRVAAAPPAEMPVATSWCAVARFLGENATEAVGRAVGEACAAESDATSARPQGPQVSHSGLLTSSSSQYHLWASEAFCSCRSCVAAHHRPLIPSSPHSPSQFSKSFLLAPLLDLTPMRPDFEQELIRNAYGSDPRSRPARQAVDAIAIPTHAATAAASECFSALVGLAYRHKGGGGKQPFQQAVLNLLARLTELGMIRLRVKDHTAPMQVRQAIAASHGPANNFLHSLLVLFEPVFLTHPERMAKIRPRYCRKEYHTRLARLLEQDAGGAAHEANFVTELFYMSWGAFYTSLLPALEARQQTLASISHTLQTLQQNTPQYVQLELKRWLEADKWSMTLLGSQFVTRATHLCLETAKWLAALAPDDRRESCLRRIEARRGERNGVPKVYRYFIA